MDKLWAPWRAEYIETIDQTPDTCIFCDKPRENKDRDNLILARSSHCFVIMNRFPYNNGHLLIVPFAHKDDVCGLENNAYQNLWETVRTCKKALNATLSPQGFNIGMNLGRVSGAGIDQHCHVHIVPRWNGDTNFMPVIGQTKVLSEGLFATYDKLKPAF
ncbi:MAG: HIT family hydrolase [Candidatus Raymondbacteria bacterium RifOxyA12_full_50_37]|uniref:HIT family hydrolase n=1 Tax=Candidatus Raymondbacteria bacterium RIFOXYD12_FULL_49_13 TaxID=1817890 RepID=A0A1F7F466_UNCRA|nr:MAG: HIT family hydrolase [Candidatus Raymondbacteria bacterium RifOxyA12_full_50_37]OGJ86226.1 MAG: HIT family hydrolase [Candidatus Raymondbacteria bacterium RIFOXYA2_FULL_49_16]OGJ95764.1 MAG: HIT family hydrolase [Candidatus Raymondbacteria bacterium RIFOXYC2_FULL_50_21]OGK01475.1 MAG: HIT family hydrolase [Candidatus Raymondbacteria bacterium RIFOXYD12_FULL_49_13]OGK08024.1 MAG: HIT family hydrolase [Candidatus Raymondbacteria bacterium RifOxyC12_full_50_8]OGP42677.1 MAG: HIT family hy